MFKPQEQQIYEYHDGHKVRKVDPMPIYLRLLEAAPPEELNADLAAFSSGPDKEAGTGALIRLGAHTAKAFQLPVWNEETGEGWSLTDLTMLLVNFLNFTLAQKKNTRQKRTSPSPTAQQSSVKLTTPPISDCGSTAAEPSTDSFQ
jgi:hypothetical protein